MENHAFKVLSDTNNSIYKYMLFFTKTPWKQMFASFSRVFSVSVSVSLYMLAMLMTLANTPAAVTEAPAP